MIFSYFGMKSILAPVLTEQAAAELGQAQPKLELLLETVLVTFYQWKQTVCSVISIFLRSNQYTIKLLF